MKKAISAKALISFIEKTPVFDQSTISTVFVNGIGDYGGQTSRTFAVVPNAGETASQQVVVRPLDLRSSGSRKIETLDQVFPFAMNSSPVWAKGGVAGESSFTRIREMTGSRPDDPTTWVEAGGVTNLDAVVGETTDDSWTPVRQGLYRAEMLIGDTVVGTGYFDMTETEGLAGKPSVETATVTMPAKCCERLACECRRRSIRSSCLAASKPCPSASR